MLSWIFTVLVLVTGYALPPADPENHGYAILPPADNYNLEGIKIEKKKNTLCASASTWTTLGSGGEKVPFTVSNHPYQRQAQWHSQHMRLQTSASGNPRETSRPDGASYPTTKYCDDFAGMQTLQYESYLLHITAWKNYLVCFVKIAASSHINTRRA